MDPTEAVTAWQTFAHNIRVTWNGKTTTWADHILGQGRNDEESLLQPHVFPKFADEFLGFTVGSNLAAEERGVEGRPDFRPADAGTHPFVFETKPTAAGSDFSEYHAQIRRYLREGRARIRQVVVTNLRAISVYALDPNAQLTEKLYIDLRALVQGHSSTLGSTALAQRLGDFLEEFHFRELSLDQKLQRIQAAEEWNPILEVTNPQWLADQLDRIVERLRRDIETQVRDHIFASPGYFSGTYIGHIEDELHQLEFRLGGDYTEIQDHDLHHYITSRQDSTAGRALNQYLAHTAFFTTTRLLVVRIWEDLGLIRELLRDGGFDEWMNKFGGVVADVVNRSFQLAEPHYPSLYSTQNTYTWYKPSREAYVDSIFDLSNLYVGAIDSDVLGIVYERLLERVDRKNVGQFYTPRDIIRLIWDLLGLTDVALEAEEEDRELRVFDIATGSGGFLVEAARVLRQRYGELKAMGANIDNQVLINRIASGLVGAELQRFPTYLAEINLLVQLSPILHERGQGGIPPLGTLCTDTLSLHEPQRMDEKDPVPEEPPLLMDEFRQDTYQKVKDVDSSGFLVDVACGNPPYVGEKRAAPILSRTRQLYPYWDDFVAPHLDILYWFLIVGISKLREGGRFGFITTEYWLRSDGGRPLRQYIAERCSVDTILLFRDMRLFPDAPGQHSMVVVGTRRADRGERGTAGRSFPQVLRYEGRNLSYDERQPVLDAFRARRRGSGVTAFRAPLSPNQLLGNSWGEVVLSPAQLARRRRLTKNAKPLRVRMEEGVIATPDRLRRKDDADQLPAKTLRRLNYPTRRPGIFILTQQELGHLGSLTQAEREVCRPLINTKDVFPYAAVTPENPEVMLYLPRPANDKGDVIERQSRPFPEGMPVLERHFRQFEPLLRAKVQRWNERRPWWSVHRAREQTIRRDKQSTSQFWSAYALTTRWGAGGRLVAGLAPLSSVPASGLHTLYAGDSATAAYLVGVIQSSPVQDLADTLPPGEVRQDDLEALGLPYIPDIADQVTSLATRLADMVHELVRDFGSVWPELPDALREDPVLGTWPDHAWLPRSKPSAHFGKIGSVNWVRDYRYSGALSDPIESVDTARSLFGNTVTVTGRTTGMVRLTVDAEDEELLNLVAALMLGLRASGVALRSIPEVEVPISLERLASMYGEDWSHTNAVVEEYWNKRREIDELVSVFI